jgi:hypothetical protein
MTYFQIDPLKIPAAQMRFLKTAAKNRKFDDKEITQT